MKLPDDFQFSQSNLQDFVACARRFQLRYIQRLKWPAVEADPVLEHERLMRQGAIFHRMVQQQVMGVPGELLLKTVTDEPLRRWWQNFQQAGLDGLPDRLLPEVTLSASLAGNRLVAKYDLLAIEPGGRAIIVDWKTSLRKPGRERLKAQLQTVIYRYVLVKAGTSHNAGQPIPPEHVEMIYWFAEHPDSPEHFPYDSSQLKADEDYLLSLIRDITSRNEDDFELTPHEAHCVFCTYRSLCDRGQKAGNFLEEGGEVEAADELGFDFDFDQIAEIEF